MGAERIRRAFDTPAFIGFLTGGDPSLEDTRRYVNLLARTGASLVEIGIPFSDPIAEGPVIQEASARALSAGTTPEKLFSLVQALREEDGLQIPLALMTYLNPVHHYGYDAFFARAAEVGVDALIIPDLPFEEHGEVLEQAHASGVALISMIAPTSMQAESRASLLVMPKPKKMLTCGARSTSMQAESRTSLLVMPKPQEMLTREARNTSMQTEGRASLLAMPKPKKMLTCEARNTSANRIRMIASKAEGFIYLVSSLGVTGTRSEITTDISSIVSEIRSVTDVPVAVGFGISTPRQGADMAAQADGVIVGSAIVRLIAEHGSNADRAVSDYVADMVAAIQDARSE